jgi:Tol biopolymer transport system component
VVIATGVALLPSPAMAAATTTRISSDPAGGPGNGGSYFAAVNASGRYVAFVSGASNLVGTDTHGHSGIFLRDRLAGTTELVSVNSRGEAANGPSFGPAKLSPDGRYVVFVSAATNLVSGDTNDTWDVFLRDRKTRTTRRVNLSSGGAQANDVSFWVAVSANGRYVAFGSSASNLVANDTNGKRDVFVRDLKTGRTRLVSVRQGGHVHGDADSTSPAISDDGRYVAFLSSATNFGTTNLSGGSDAYVKDLRTGRLDLVSLNSQGKQFYGGPAELAMSGDGRLVAFSAYELFPYQPQVYVRDLKAKTTTTASVAADGSDSLGGSYQVSISHNGRYVAFGSGAHNLFPNTPFYTNVFVRDLKTRTTTPAGYTTTGAFINGHQSEPAMSDGGVAFRAEVPGIVPGPAGTPDLFQVYFRSL